MVTLLDPNFSLRHHFQVETRVSSMFQETNVAVIVKCLPHEWVSLCT